jgi:hypothetical protein
MQKPTANGNRQPKSLGWQKAIEDASVPELKDILRMIKTRHVEGKKLFEDLRNGDLRDIVEEVCLRYDECREFVESVLKDESEDEMTLAKKLLLDESDSAVEVLEDERAIMRKRKAEFGSHSSRKGAKKSKRTSVNNSEHTTKEPKPEDKCPELRDGNKRPTITDPASFSHPSTKITALPTAPPKKKTVDDIFAAYEKRREEEAREQEEMRKACQEYDGVYLDPWMARCARCGEFFDKTSNNLKLCIFHTGKIIYALLYKHQWMAI